MHRRKLAKYTLLFLALPFAAYWLVQCIAAYTTPMPSYRKTPYQLEEAFNEQMAQYSMSIDLDNGSDSEEDDYLKTTIPVDCTDGSRITCIFYTYSDQGGTLKKHIIFEQELNGENGETVYLEPFLRFILDEFVTVMTENKDETLNSFSVSYNEALKICQDFIRSNDSEAQFSVSVEEDIGRTITLKRKTGEEPSLSIQLSLREVFIYP